MAIWDLGWFAILIIGETHLFGAGDAKIFVGAARNRVFSRILRCSRRYCEKPGFFDFDAGRETGFFPRISIHRVKTAKNPVSLG
jgi:hypothetical protein